MYLSFIHDTRELFTSVSQKPTAICFCYTKHTSMTETLLFQKRCMPCEGGVMPLGQNEARKLMAELPEWRFNDDFLRISRTFSFQKFMDSIAFVNNIATVAEQENHHPDMKISYRKVTITLTTHALHGLSENDFILAAKIDKLILK